MILANLCKCPRVRYFWECVDKFRSTGHDSHDTHESLITQGLALSCSFPSPLTVSQLSSSFSHLSQFVQLYNLARLASSNFLYLTVIFLSNFNLICPVFPLTDHLSSIV